MRSFTIQQAAQLLGIKPKGFFRFLRQHGFLSQHNLPHTLFIQKELFEISHVKWLHPANQTEQISSRALLTQKGVAYFDELLRQHAPQALRQRNRTAANESGAASRPAAGAQTAARAGQAARTKHLCPTEPNKVKLIESVIHNWHNIARNAVVIDLETSGLDNHDEIVEISIIDSKGAVLLDTLVRPMSDIAEAATKIHGITNADVEHAPCWSEISSQVRTILHQRKAIAYNAAFERRLLDQAINLYGEQNTTSWQTDFLCAMESYADFRAVPCNRNGHKWHKLSAAAQHEGLELPTNLHRSLADAQLTLALINTCYQQLRTGATA